MWSDNETSTDLFGFRVHADLLRELVLDSKVLPVTIGVFGDWGGGKSSIMQMLKEDLDRGDGDSKKTGVAVLYFNGWLFEGYDDAKSALLGSILTSLRDHQTFGAKIKVKATNLLKRVNFMRGARILLSGAAVGGAVAATGGLGLAALLPAILAGAAGGAKEAVPDALDGTLDSPPDGAEVVEDIRKFREDFAELLRTADISHLVVLIDDLDRCSPERIIDNLEAIKLFLNVPNTAFVIGADRRIIRQAVTWRYREALAAVASTGSLGDDGADRLVEDYLEKLIQIPYRLPKLSPSEVETYLTLLFCERHLPAPDFTKVIDYARTVKAKDRYRAFDQACAFEALSASPPASDLAQSLRIGARIAGQITDVLMGNPRQVKRFLNAFFLRRRLAEVAELKEVEDETLVKLMLLEYSAPKLFDGLFRKLDGQSGVISQLAELEAAVSEGQPARSDDRPELPEDWRAMRRWLSMEPRLGGVDLRDYMWVTRDRLGLTLSGTTLVPTIVRTTIKQLLSELQSAEGHKVVKGLAAHEREMLLDQLEQVAQRDPSKIAAFKAFLEIAETYNEAAERLPALLERIPEADLPPPLAVIIERIAKKGGRVGSILAGIVKSYDGKKSRFAKAFTTNKERK